MEEIALSNSSITDRSRSKQPLSSSIMTAIAELLGRKPRWRFFFVAFGSFWFGLATAVLILMLR
jgi:hypothetical protein